MCRAPNPVVLRFAALTLADAVRGESASSQRLNELRRKLTEAAAPFLYETEIECAMAAFRRVIEGILDLLPEFAGDVAEGFERDGVDGVRVAFAALLAEQRVEIVRALMRLAAADDG